MMIDGFGLTEAFVFFGVCICLTIVVWEGCMVADEMSEGE
jgi:hypothetical protein